MTVRKKQLMCLLQRENKDSDNEEAAAVTESQIARLEEGKSEQMRSKRI
jgi:DNA-binding Xre family transcriptional regulator